MTPKLRQIADPEHVARILGLAAEEDPALLVSALKLAHRANAKANERARLWKATAKRLWGESVYYGRGRGYAAVDIRLTEDARRAKR